MAEYKGIKGFKVQYLDQDPVPAVAGWSAGNNMNTGRYGLASANAGTQTAALGFGGYTTTFLTATEEYDGNSWTNSNPLNTARFVLAGAGTQTAGLAFGGYAAPPTLNTGATEEYDGISWSTSPGSLNTARNFLGGAGTQTAAVAFGGKPPTTAATEVYNGITWTNSTNMGTARSDLAGAGLQSSALAIGGYTTADSAATEEYTGVYVKGIKTVTVS